MKNIRTFQDLSDCASALSLLANLFSNHGLRFTPPTYQLGRLGSKALFMRPSGSSDEDFGLFVEVGMAFGDDGVSIEPFVRFVDRFSSACTAVREASDGWFVSTCADDSPPSWFVDLADYAHSLPAGDSPGCNKAENINVFFSTALLILQANARGERWKPQDAAT